MMSILCLRTLTLAQAAPAWWPWPQRTRDVIHNWTDTFNFLDLIPGPPFLGLFILYAAVVFCVLWIVRNMALRMIEQPSILLSSPEAAFRYKPSYLDVAFLRGGKKALYEAVVCSLYQRGLIDRRLKPVMNASVLEKARRLNRIEHAIWSRATDLGQGVEIRESNLVTQELSIAADECRTRLVERGLLYGSEAALVTLGSAALSLMLIDGLGIIRLIRSTMRGYHNVGVLVMLILILSIAAAAGLYYIRRTRSGDAYLKLLEQEAYAMRRNMQARTKRYTDPDALYAIAALGAIWMTDTGYKDVYESLEGIAWQARQAKHSSGGICSSCSGGGCGGGGCGGGGCGGGGCGGG